MSILRLLNWDVNFFKRFAIGYRTTQLIASAAPLASSVLVEELLVRAHALVDVQARIRAGSGANLMIMDNPRHDPTPFREARTLQRPPFQSSSYHSGRAMVFTLDGSQASYQAVAELKAEGVLPAQTLVPTQQVLE